MHAKQICKLKVMQMVLFMVVVKYYMRTRWNQIKVIDLENRTLR